MASRSFLFTLLALLSALFLLSGCAAPVPTQVEIDSTQLAAIVRGTQTALAAGATAGAPSATPLPPATEQPAAESSATPAAASTPLPPTETAALAPTETASPMPSPTAVLENCANKAKFVEETVPDDTAFVAKQPFVKTWSLRNVGDCTWTAGYSLIFIQGEQMGAPTSIPITQTVNADGVIVLSLNLVTPAKAGVYQGDWKLKSAAGQIFGIGKNADESFWVKITVVESVADLNLGAPTSLDSFDSAETSAWPLGEEDNLKYEIRDHNLIMTARQPVGDLWRVDTVIKARSLYLQANFKTGESCAGKDSYGLIIRTFPSDSGAYDNGYIFAFSCDGMYRLYRLSGGEYTGIVEWTPSADLRRGPDQANQMGIWAKGDLIRLYINGKKVAELTGVAEAQGQVGLTVRAAGETDFQVTVEDFAFWNLE